MDAAPDFSLLSFPELLAVDTEKLSPQEYQEWLAAYSDTPVGFVEEVLGLELYGWQDDALQPLDDLMDDKGMAKRKQIAVVAPNAGGKSERIVAGASLYWVNVHAEGTVVITTRDSKQLLNQILPAMWRHKPKFPDSWHWVGGDRPKVVTDTGGRILMFTTNDEGRAEGYHMDFDPFAEKFDGPLLVIIDEAKSVPDRIYTATDRCTFNARLEVSSPGKKAGRFYNGVKKGGSDGRIIVRAGLKDCPHIPQSKIDSIIEEHGLDAPFTRSTLYGEFMDTELRGRFDRQGIAKIRENVITATSRRIYARIDPQPGNDRTATMVPCAANDPSAWLIFWELGPEQKPKVGCRYIISVDTASFKEQQNEENDARDCHAVLILRDAYTNDFGQIMPPAVIGRIIPPCRWSLEIISERIAWLSRWMKNTMVVVEANNTGIALLVMLKALNVDLYRRATGNPENAVFKPGFHTSSDTKPLIISHLASALRYRPADLDDPLDQGQDQQIDIWDEHIADELSYFAYLPDGSEGAEPGLHDDDVLSLSIGLHCLKSGTIYKGDTLQRRQAPKLAGAAS